MKTKFEMGDKVYVVVDEFADLKCAECNGEGAVTGLTKSGKEITGECPACDGSGTTEGKPGVYQGEVVGIIARTGTKSHDNKNKEDYEYDVALNGMDGQIVNVDNDLVFATKEEADKHQPKDCDNCRYQGKKCFDCEDMNKWRAKK